MEGEREPEQYFKASWPVFDPLFLRVCRDHQQQGIVLLEADGSLYSRDAPPD